MRARSLALFAIVSGSAGCQSAPSPATALSARWVAAPPSDPLTGWQLEDHLGSTFSEQRFDDHVSVIAVGYTSCPDVCPTTLQSVGPAMVALRADGHPVQGVFLAVDPERDRERLPTYVPFFAEEGLTGVTGSKPHIDHAIEQLGAAYAMREEDGFVFVDHPASLFVLGPDRRMLGYLLRHDRIVDDLTPILQGAR